MIERVFVDMDGVIADYYRVILQYTKANITYDEWLPGDKGFEEVFGMPYSEVMMNTGSEFWATIPRTPWFDALFRAISHSPATENAEIHILTSPPFVEHHEGITPRHISDAVCGKLEWCRDNVYLLYIGGMVSFSWKKYIAGNEQSLMIDDSEHNIDPFVENGGYGILVPGLHNRRHAEYYDLLEDPDRWFRNEMMKFCPNKA